LQLHERLQDVTGKIIGDCNSEFVNCSTRQLSKDASTDHKQRLIVDKLVAEKERWERQVKHALEAEQDYVTNRVGRPLEAKPTLATTSKPQGITRLLQQAQERLVKSVEFPNYSDQTKFRTKVGSVFSDLTEQVRIELSSHTGDADSLRLKRELVELQDRYDSLTRELRRKEAQLTDLTGVRASQDKLHTSASIQRVSESLDFERKQKVEALRELEKANAEITRLQRQLALTNTPAHSDRYREPKLSEQISRLQRDLHQDSHADSRFYQKKSPTKESPERSRYLSGERSPLKSPSNSKATEESLAYLLDKEKERSLTFYRALKRKERECEESHGPSRPPMMEELSELSQRLKETIESKLRVEELKQDLELDNKRLSEVIRELKMKQAQADQTAAFKLEQADRSIKSLTEQVQLGYSRVNEQYLGIAENSSSISRQRSTSTAEVDRLKAEIERLKEERGQVQRLEAQTLKSELDSERRKREDLLRQLSSVGQSEAEVQRLSSEIVELKETSRRQAEELSRREEAFARAVAREKEGFKKQLEAISQQFYAENEVVVQRLDEFQEALDGCNQKLDFLQDQDYEEVQVSRAPQRAGAGLQDHFQYEVEGEPLEASDQTDKLQAANEDLKRELSELERHSKDQRSTIKEQEIAIEQLTKTCRHTEEQLKQAKVHEEKVNAEVESLQVHFQQKLKEANSKSERTAKEKQDMAVRVQNIEMKQEELARQNKNKEDQLVTATQEIRQLELANEALKGKLEARMTSTSHVDSLETRLNSVVKSITMKDDVIKKLDREKGELGARLRAVKSEADRLKEHSAKVIDDKTAQLEEALGQVEMYRGQVRQLQQSHAEIEEELKDLKDSFSSVESSAKVIKSLTARVEELTSENEHLKEQLELAESESRVLEKRADKAVLDSQEQDSEVKRVRRELEQMRRDLSEAQRMSELLREDNAKLEQELSEKDQDLLVASVLKDDLSPATGLIEAVEGYDGSNRADCRRCLGIQEQVKTLEQDLEDSRSLGRKYEDSYKELKRHLDVSTSQQAELQGYLDETRIQNLRLEEELDAALLAKEKAESALEVESSLMKAQAAALEESRSNSEGLDRSLKETQGKLLKLKEDYRDLKSSSQDSAQLPRGQTELDETAEALRKAKGQIAELSQQKEELELELEVLREDEQISSSLQIEKEDLEDANAQLRQQTDDLKATTESLKGEVSRLQQSCQTEQIARQQAEAEISKLQNELAQLNVELDEKFEELMASETKLNDIEALNSQLALDIEDLRELNQATHKKLSKKVKDLEGSLGEVEATKRHLEGQLEQRNQALAELQHKLDTNMPTSGGLDELSEQYSQLQADYAEATSQLELAQTAFVELDEQSTVKSSALSAEVALLTTHLEAREAAFKAELSELEERVVLKDEYLLDLELSYQSLKEQFSSLQEKTQQMRTKMTDDIEGLAERLETTHIEKQAVQYKLDKAVKDLAAHQQRVEELTAHAGAADDYQEQIRQLEAEVASERSKGAMQLAEVQRLKVRVEEGEEASQQADYLESQVQQLTQQIERLEKAGEDADNAHYAEQQELCAKIKDLEGKLAEANLKNDTLEASQLNEVGLTEELEKLKGTLQEKDREIERLHSETLDEHQEFAESFGQFEDFHIRPARTGQSNAPEGHPFEIEAESNELAEEVEYYREIADAHALTIQDLQSDQATLQQRIEELQRQDQHLKDQVQQLQSENEALRLTDLQLHAAELELTKKLEKYRTKISRQTDRIAELTTQRQDNDDQIELGREDEAEAYQALQAEHQTLRQEVQRLEIAEQSLTSQIQDLQSENEGLRRNDLKLHAAEQELTKQLEKYRTKISRQTDTIAELTTARQDNEGAEDLRIKAETDSLLILDLQSQADTLKQSLFELKTTEQRLTEELQRLQGENEALRRTDLQLRAVEQELTKQLEDYRTNSGTSEQEVDLLGEIEQMRRDESSMRTRYEEEAFSLAARVEDYRTEAANYEAEIERLEQALHDKDSEIADGEDAKSRLKAQLDSALKSAELQVSKVKFEYDSQLQILNLELDEYRDASSKLETKDSTQAIEIDSLKHSLAQLQMARTSFEEAKERELEEIEHELALKQTEFDSQLQRLSADLQAALADGARHRAVAEQLSSLEYALEISQLEEDLTNSVNLGLTLKKQVEAQAMELSSLSSDKAMASLRLESEIKKREEVSRDLVGSRSETELQRSERNRLTQQLSAMQEVLKNKEEDLSTTKKELNETKRILNRSTEELTSLQQKFELTKRDSLQLMRSQSEGLKSKELETQVEDLNKTLTEMTFRLATAVQERDDLKAEVIETATDSRLAEQYEKATDRIAQLESELRKAKENQGRLEQLKVKYEGVSETLRETTQELEGVQKQYQDAVNGRKEMAEELQRLNLENSRLMASRDDLTALNSRLEKSVKQLEMRESIQSSGGAEEEEDSFYDLAHNAKVIDRYVYEGQDWALLCMYSDKQEYNWELSSEALKYVPDYQEWPDSIQDKLEQLAQAKLRLETEAGQLRGSLAGLMEEQESIKFLISSFVPTSSSIVEDLRGALELLRPEGNMEEAKLEKAESNDIEEISGKQVGSAKEYDRMSQAESIPVSDMEFASLQGKLESFNDIVTDYEAQINAQSIEISSLKQACDLLRGSKETQKYTAKVSDAVFKAFEGIGPQPSDVEVKIDTLMVISKMTNDLREALKMRRSGGQTSPLLQDKKKKGFMSLFRKNRK
jgi:chromosome segregation ATPase